MLKDYLTTLNNERDKNNNLPEVIDLFSGCGGLSFGFKTAGYRIAQGIEMSQSAANTASYNLHWRDGIDKQHICGDITTLDSSVLKSEIGENGCIVVGGPPCQAYSQIGRAKLRSLGENRKHTNDSRGFLFQDFLRFALELDAKGIVMENVPEAVNYGGINIPQHVCEILEESGYEACWTILNAADYGVPQKRERVFVMAVKKSAGHSINLPKPTHFGRESEITPGQLRIKKLRKNKNFRMPNPSHAGLPAWVTSGEALSDLPELFPDASGIYHLYKPYISFEYNGAVQNDYQQLMRNWFGREEKMISGHGFRNTARDFPIFGRMSPGDDYLAASKIAEEILDEKCRLYSVVEKENPEMYRQLKKKTVPPYSKEKFHTKWRKLSFNQPSHTLVAHLSTDTYSHLHPWEPRGISVREAARLQSFPDGFLFQCSMGDAFRQIGNAVPPLLAFAVARAMKENLTGIKEEGEKSGYAHRDQAPYRGNKAELCSSG